jgi:predicted TIM-barrel fold metal-dependent hydrolase
VDDAGPWRDRRDLRAGTLAPSLAAHGLDRTLLVQGANLNSDTGSLFELADGVCRVGSVTAWPLASDWPVALLDGDYDRVWGTLVEVLELVSPDCVLLILGETARDLYELDEKTRRALRAG